jgi:hypothetical protein
VATLAKLEDGHSDVDGEGDVVVEFGPGGVSADFDEFDGELCNVFDDFAGDAGGGAPE